MGHYHVEVWLPDYPKKEDALEAASLLIDNLCGEEEGYHFDYGGPGMGFAGEHVKYDPTKDPSCQSPCPLCGGIGTWGHARISRELKDGRLIGKGLNKCWNCGGTGKECKMPDSHPSDVMPVVQVKKHNPTMKPYALVTYGALSRDTRVEELQSRETVFDVLKRLKLKGGTLVTCDCHS